MVIDKRLLEILCCPKCQGDLIENETFLICKNCSKKYLVKDEIPVLLLED